MSDYLPTLVVGLRRMIDNGFSDEEIAESIRLSWYVRDREKTAIVETLAGMAKFAEQERVTFNADAILAEASHMAREMMK